MNRYRRWAAPGLAGVMGLALIGVALPAVARGGDPGPGAEIYARRCASCHEDAAGRAPSRGVLAARPAAAIEAALGGGVMAPMAAGLSGADIKAVAAYLSATTAARAGPSEAPPCTGSPPALDPGASSWNGWGAGPEETRFQPDPGLTADGVPRLKLKWAMAFAGGRNGQATAFGGRLFLSTGSGAVYSLDPASGCAHWRFQAAGATRATTVVGAITGPRGETRYAVYVTDATRAAYAIDARTGALIWKITVDDQPVAAMTGSPVLGGGRLYVPVSSSEEAAAMSPAYACCRFRGAVVALDAASGRILWKTYTTPGEARPYGTNALGRPMSGPAGAAVWSAPTFDAKRGLVYVGTGDSYTDAPFRTDDAILALDAATGAVRWQAQFAEADNYIIGCAGPNAPANCPRRLGPDHDFGASPILRTVQGGRQLILAGQKSGQVYALDPDHDGAVVWSRRLSPGGPLGGVEWGMSADAEALFAPISDLFGGAGARPGLQALRMSDGAPLWSAPSPPTPCRWSNPYCAPALSQAISAMPGVVFAGAMNGRLRAYDSAGGAVIWTFDTGAVDVITVLGKAARGGVLDAAGPTIAGGRVFVLSGYLGRSGAANTVLMAFSVDGR